MKTTTMHITGMHCASCATLLTKALQKVSGVKSAIVNYATEKATVEHDDSTTLEQLIKAVQNKGYQASLETGKSKDREKKKREQEINKQKTLLMVGIAMSIPALFLGMLLMDFPYRNYLLLILATPVQFMVGWQFYRGAWVSLKNKTSNMDTLIALGTSAAFFFSVYVTFFDPMNEQYFETAAILITLVVLGKFLEARAKGKTSEAIKKLMNLAPKQALVIRNGKEVLIPADQVIAGDLIKVKPGEKIPVDGIVVEGNTSIDESMITGESIPVEKKKNDKVIGGTMNKNGSVIFKATKVGSETVLAQIIKLVEDAQGHKAPIQRFADAVSAWFVPAVLVIAILTFLGWFFIGTETFSFALIVTVAVLVIACPCALGLATPTAIMVGTGKGAEKGILIKGGEALETTHKIKHIIFDKTGTITHGKPIVTEIVPLQNQSEKEIMVIAASLEKNSEHPLAEAIVKHAEENKIDLCALSNFQAIPGKGISGSVIDKNRNLKNKKVKYYLGNMTLCKENKINITFENKISELENQGKTVMILTDDKKPLALIAVADTMKENVVSAMRKLKQMGITPYMITGDNERTAKAIAHKAGIEHIFANVLPHEKAEHVKRLQQHGKKVAMVGDGINDAPALAQADVGIAMSSGTDVAMESGSIVLMKNDIQDVIRAIILSKQTMSKIKQNMFWALVYNVLGIPIAAGALYPFTGWLLSPIIAGGAMALSSVSVVGNSLLLKAKRLR
ncbi:copper-translocating P-type ATPase [Candidatus Woesearchaeota archaeon]|nr:copper-translocating P-type ATPase [Candidatus Woesearchaeota archaeon]